MSKPKWMVIGIDPDSNRLTATLSDQDDVWKVRRKVLPQAVPWSRKLQVARAWVYKMVLQYRADGYTVHVFIEQPFVSPKFPNAAIPLCRINGVLLESAEAAGAYTVHETGIQQWKKSSVGKGNASKPEVETWCRIHWPKMFDHGQTFTKAEGRQDIYDSAGINRYGVSLIGKMQHRSEFYEQHPEDMPVSRTMKKAGVVKTIKRKR